MVRESWRPITLCFARLVIAIPVATTLVGPIPCKYGNKNGQKRGFSGHTCRKHGLNTTFTQVWPF